MGNLPSVIGKKCMASMQRLRPRTKQAHDDSVGTIAPAEQDAACLHGVIAIA